MRVVYETEDQRYRIIEIADESARLEDLKGDSYDVEANPDIDPQKLKTEEKEFERLVDAVGVFGYALEKWNPKAGHGYETMDSCFGFVGRFDKDDPIFAHYIVDEMKALITTDLISS